MTEILIFKRKTTQSGGSTIITIPPEIIEYLSLKEGDEIGLSEKEPSRDMKHIKLWNYTAKKKEDEELEPLIKGA